MGRRVVFREAGPETLHRNPARAGRPGESRGVPGDRKGVAPEPPDALGGTVDSTSPALRGHRYGDQPRISRLVERSNRHDQANGRVHAHSETAGSGGLNRLRARRPLVPAILFPRAPSFAGGSPLRASGSIAAPYADRAGNGSRAA